MPKSLILAKRYLCKAQFEGKNHSNCHMDGGSVEQSAATVIVLPVYTGGHRNQFSHCLSVHHFNVVAGFSRWQCFLEQVCWQFAMKLNTQEVWSWVPNPQIRSRVIYPAEMCVCVFQGYLITFSSSRSYISHMKCSSTVVTIITFPQQYQCLILPYRSVKLTFKVTFSMVK